MCLLPPLDNQLIIHRDLLQCGQLASIPCHSQFNCHVFQIYHHTIHTFDPIYKKYTLSGVNLSDRAGGRGDGGQCGVNSTKLPPLSKDTLTERHAQPGFDPGFTDWVPTLLATDPSEAGIKVECSHRTTWHSPPIPIILTAVVLLHTTRG